MRISKFKAFFEEELFKKNSNVLDWSLYDDEVNDDYDSDDENYQNAQADMTAISDFDLSIRNE